VQLEAFLFGSGSYKIVSRLSNVENQLVCNFFLASVIY
jgi:hypothetical protein